MIYFSNTILYLTGAYSLYVTLYLLFINKELNFINPFFLLLILFQAYFLLPAIFIEEIRYYYNWSFSDEDIFFASILTSLLLSVFSAIAYKFKHIKLREYSTIKISKSIKIIWFLILIYLIYVTYHKFTVGELFFNTNYKGTEDIYKLKNLAYLLIPISALYYISSKKFFIFLPSILIIVLDLLEGSRTTALLILIPMFLIFSIVNRKMYIPYILSFIILLSVVGIFRSDNVVQNTPTYLNSMGEFRETYLPLPIFIGDDDFIGRGDMYTFLSSISFSFLQPLRNEISKTIVFPGQYSARAIGRGYGLGANIIMDSIYYGYLFIFVTIGFVLLISYYFYITIQKVPMVYSIIFMSYFFIFLRLSIREGVFYNMSLMAFIMIVYMMPILILNKFSKRIKGYNDENK